MKKHTQEDLYSEILGIQEGERPPNYYALLGLCIFESNGKSIHSAGLKQLKMLKEWQVNPDPKIMEAVQQMMNQVSRACTILEVQKKKEQYDKHLSEKLHVIIAVGQEVLSVQSELIKCPHCGEELSSNAMFCIDCGYNFKTKGVWKTLILTEYDDEIPPWTITISGYRYSLKKYFYGLCVFILLLAIAGGIGALIYFHKGDYEIVGTISDVDIDGHARNSPMSTSEWSKKINQSFWKYYFDYKNKYKPENKPFIRFELQSKKKKEGRAYSMKIFAGAEKSLFKEYNDCKDYELDRSAIELFTRDFKSIPNSADYLKEQTKNDKNKAGTLSSILAEVTLEESYNEICEKTKAMSSPTAKDMEAIRSLWLDLFKKYPSDTNWRNHPTIIKAYANYDEIDKKINVIKAETAMENGYKEVCDKVKTMPTTTEEEMNKIIKVWDNFLGKYPRTLINHPIIKKATDNYHKAVESRDLLRDNKKSVPPAKKINSLPDGLKYQ